MYDHGCGADHCKIRRSSGEDWVRMEAMRLLAVVRVRAGRDCAVEGGVGKQWEFRTRTKDASSHGSKSGTSEASKVKQKLKCGSAHRKLHFKLFEYCSDCK